MKHQPLNALVVDWDFFFPDDPAWEWATGESPFLINDIWPIRAANFMVRGGQLPEVNQEWNGFWKRFSFTFGAKLYIGDSNSLAFYAILMELNRLDRVGVFSYDAHHDCGYQGRNSAEVIGLRGGRVSCEDWMIPLGQAGVTKSGRVPNLHVVYPDWKTEALAMEPTPFFPLLDRRFDKEIRGGYHPPTYDMVFLCRSGAWVPPWEDEKFFRLVDDASKYLEVVNMDDVTMRRFDRDQALELTAAMSLAMVAHLEKRSS